MTFDDRGTPAFEPDGVYRTEGEALAEIARRNVVTVPTDDEQDDDGGELLDKH